MATLEDAVRFDRELRPRALPALLGDFGLSHLTDKVLAADLDLLSAKLLRREDLVELGVHGDADRDAFLDLLRTRGVGVIVWYREDRGIGFIRPLGTDFEDGLANVFVARADIVRGAKSLRSGVFVSYVADAADGGPNAVARDLRTLGSQAAPASAASKAADWRCNCGEVNFSRRSSCRRCDAPRVEGGPALSKTVFVGSLGPETKAPAIKRYFERLVGKVVDCSVVPGKYYGFVTFETPQMAEKALGKHVVDGRLLTVKKDTRPRDPKGLSGLPRSRAASDASEGNYAPPPAAPRPRVDVGPPPENAWGGAGPPETAYATPPTGWGGAPPPPDPNQPRQLGRSELVDDAALRGFADLIARDTSAPQSNGFAPPPNGHTLQGWGGAPGFGQTAPPERPSLVDALGGVELAPAAAQTGFFGPGLGGWGGANEAPPGMHVSAPDPRSLQEEMQDAIKSQDREAIRQLMSGRDVGADGERARRDSADLARREAALREGELQRRQMEADAAHRRQAEARAAQLRAAEHGAREAALREAREQREAGLRAREAEASRVTQAAADEAASLALARRMLADDEAALQARANAPQQAFSTVTRAVPTSAPQRLPSAKPVGGSAYDPAPSLPEVKRRVDAFIRAKSIDARAAQRMRGLTAQNQIRLLRRLEARPVDSAVVMAAATRGDDFAATAAELDQLPSLALRKSCDRLALTSAAVALLVTLALKDQDRVAASFDSPGGLRGLRNVEGFVRACFVGDKAVRNRAASAAARLVAAGGPPPRREPEQARVAAPSKAADTSAEAVAPTLRALRAWLGGRPEGRMRSGEIDRFFNAHRGLPKPRGIKWLDQHLKQYGMRKKDSGNRSYFFIEIIAEQ